MFTDRWEILLQLFSLGTQSNRQEKYSRWEQSVRAVECNPNLFECNQLPLVFQQLQGLNSSGITRFGIQLSSFGVHSMGFQALHTWKHFEKRSLKPQLKRAISDLFEEKALEILTKGSPRKRFSRKDSLDSLDQEIFLKRFLKRRIALFTATSACFAGRTPNLRSPHCERIGVFIDFSGLLSSDSELSNVSRTFSHFTH